MERPTVLRGGGLRWAGAGCALTAVVLTVLVVLEWRPLVRYDIRVARTLHAEALAHPALAQANRILTDWIWDPWTMRALLVLACWWLWWRGERALAVRFALAGVLATLLQQGLKAVVGRERPVWPDPVDSADYAAYPSGHALTAAVVCGLLLWLFPSSTGARAAAVVSVLGVGFTRILLGVHWLSDVVGGWLLGVVVVALAVEGTHRPRPLLGRTGSEDPDSGS
ncbi:phosphatase PAP2 family protein [Streptomyces sp. NPDC051211]|uniref:phosphatase PAP2 family protein n=1 Tax=Streptomyces sp. NPDC051211 TaxID=3154643 RepID=UPI00344E1564